MTQMQKAKEKPHEGYFLGFSGYALPLKLTDPVTKAEAQKHRAYYRANYDADGNLAVLEKNLDGKVFFRHEYLYYPNGVIREARVLDQNGRLVIHTFDESGERLDTR